MSNGITFIIGTNCKCGILRSAHMIQHSTVKKDAYGSLQN